MTHERVLTYLLTYLAYRPSVSSSPMPFVHPTAPPGSRPAEAVALVAASSGRSVLRAFWVRTINGGMVHIPVLILGNLVFYLAIYSLIYLGCSSLL